MSDLTAQERAIEEKLRAALKQSDALAALRRLRRSSLRLRDATLAAASLIHIISLEPDSGRRLRLLRQYLKESGSPFAASVLSKELERRGSRSDTRPWDLVQWKRGSDYLFNKEVLFARAFGYPMPSSEKQRSYLTDLRGKAMQAGDRRPALLATRRLAELELSRRAFRRARELGVDLVAQDPSAESYELLGRACEGGGDRGAAREAYSEAVTLAQADGNAERLDRLEARLRGLGK